MTSHERRQSLIELLRTQPGLRVPEIAQALQSSEGTVRNDMNALQQAGLLSRFHGGAVLIEKRSLSSTSFSARHHQNSPQKEIIARFASQRVNDGDAILLDASSTAYYLGLALKDRQRLRVVTNGLDVARLLASNPTNTVILIGGILNQDGSSVTGLFSEQVIEELHVQKAFVSCTGFSLASGLTEEHMEEALLKKKAIESAKEVIALVDSSKIGKDDLIPFARLEQICCLYTDEGLTSECQDMVEKAGISLTVCRNI